MVSDQIADLLTRIRNAQNAGHPTVTVPASRTKQRLLKVLLEENYIAAVEEVRNLNDKPTLKVYLRYLENDRPVIRNIRRLSRPGKRWYVAKDTIPVSKGGLGLIVVSTSKGMLSDRMARQEGIGGELICSVF